MVPRPSPSRRAPLTTWPPPCGSPGRSTSPWWERCVSEIVRRHEVLRTTFDVVDGLPLADRPCRRGAADRAGSTSGALACGAAGRRGPAPRSSARRGGRSTRRAARSSGSRSCGSDRKNSILLWVVHHLVFDGWSTSLVLAEFAALYTALSAGRPAAARRPAAAVRGLRALAARARGRRAARGPGGLLEEAARGAARAAGAARGSPAAGDPALPGSAALLPCAGRARRGARRPRAARGDDPVRGADGGVPGPPRPPRGDVRYQRGHAGDEPEPGRAGRAGRLLRQHRRGPRRPLRGSAVRGAARPGHGGRARGAGAPGGAVRSGGGGREPGPGPEPRAALPGDVRAPAGAAAAPRDTGPEVRLLDLDVGGAQFDLSLNLAPDEDELAGALEYDTDLFDAAHDRADGR